VSPELSAIEIAGVGRAFIVIVLVAVAVHPFESVAVTTYEPAEPTEIDEVVAPVLQR
jgi:hypothetical protein